LVNGNGERTVTLSTFGSDKDGLYLVVVEGNQGSFAQTDFYIGIPPVTEK
jgi:hypothetical protein